MALAVGALPPFPAGWGGTCPQCPPRFLRLWLLIINNNVADKRKNCEIYSAMAFSMVYPDIRYTRYAEYRQVRALSIIITQLNI